MEHIKKPDWLKIKIGANSRYSDTKRIVETNNLHTICSSGRCPNMCECWGKGTATFMIGGNICTRSCKFCNTQTGKPLALDINEPVNVAKSIQMMNLSHAVITSVDRDDLPDLGASHWASTIKEIKRINPDITIEVLIPDFQGREELIDMIIEKKPDIISHNGDCKKNKSPRQSAADYDRSLKVIKRVASAKIKAKSGIMVGLGETEEEIEVVMDDLLQIGCSILTIGQYLQPSRLHYPVKKYITPEDFEKYKKIALEKGFDKVESEPLARSSYHAERHV